MSALGGALANAVLGGPAGKAARKVADWLDLEVSFLVAFLEDVAPRAKGRLLDVGCGQKPYERIFRPYVDEYIGIEFEESFVRTDSSSKAGHPDLVYDGKTLPFEDKSFDTVLSIQVL